MRTAKLLKRGVERILSSFIQRVADPNASFEARDAVCRQLGRFEAREGRSLDSLQAAYRLGLRLVWRRSVEVGNRHGIDPALVATMGDSIIAFIGELAEQSVRGHREEQARANRDLHERRARLLRHILDGGGAVSERAARAAWTPPEEITLVLMRPGEPRRSAASTPTSSPTGRAPSPACSSPAHSTATASTACPPPSPTGLPWSR